MASDPILEVHDLHYTYLDRFPALAGVSLTVERGEKLALLGANGCGKSTLLKILDGLIFADSGTFHAFGSEVTEDNLEDEQFNRGFRSRVGFVFQNSDAQVFSPTVREEIAFGPLTLGMTNAAVTARVDETLDMLDIGRLADRAPYQLSGGEKKRVAIASVLVMNPEILLFDEPTAALDPRTQQWLIELIVDLNQAGKTIVLATHDLDTLDLLADRCAVFSEDHTILTTTTPAELLEHHDVLLSVNLTHEHSHRHGDTTHAHPHNAAHHTTATPLALDEIDWHIADITCQACERTIDATIRPLAGVESVLIDIETKQLRIRFRPDRVDLTAVEAALVGAGYPPSATNQSGAP